MQAVADQRRERFGKAQGMPCHDQDLIHEMSNRLAALWHYGECVANAEGKPEVQKVWRELERQELASIGQLKQLIVRRVEEGEFLEDF